MHRMRLSRKQRLLIAKGLGAPVALRPYIEPAVEELRDRVAQTIARRIKEMFAEKPVVYRQAEIDPALLASAQVYALTDGVQ